MEQSIPTVTNKLLWASCSVFIPGLYVAGLDTDNETIFPTKITKLCLLFSVPWLKKIVLDTRTPVFKKETILKAWGLHSKGNRSAAGIVLTNLFDRALQR